MDEDMREAGREREAPVAARLKKAAQRLADLRTPDGKERQPKMMERLRRRGAVVSSVV